MGKGIVLFDIDRTIFDTVRLTKSWVPEISRIIGNVEVTEVERAKNEFINSLAADRDFDPEKFISFLCDRFNFDRPDLLSDVFYGDENKKKFHDFIFPETFEVFNKLKKRFHIGIFSEGTEKFQNYKFKAMEISEYLDKDLIFVLSNKSTPEALAKIPEGAVVVDDKESVCEYLSEHGVKTIWLNKKDGGINKNFQTIHNLLDLPGELM